MKKAKKKMNPSSYPIFAFRVSEKEKVKLTKSIEKLVTKLNNKRDDDEHVLRKNDVIVEALKIGIKALNE